MGYGIVGGILTSGRDQGRAAADLTLRILQGEDAGRIPIVNSSPNRPMFDYIQLQRFGVNPSMLPDHSVVINGPASSYVVDKKLVWAGLLGLVVLLLIAIALLFNVFSRKKVERALRISEEKYRTLINNVNIGVYRTTPEGRFLQVNPAMMQIFGCDSLEQILNTPAPELYRDTQDRQRLWDLLRKAVFLPFIDRQPVKEEPPAPTIPTGKERILFVDDERMLVDLGIEMLQPLGYSVTALQSSLEALETFRRQPDAFDLVVTDLSMPKMTGADLIRAMRKIRPGVPIVLITGYKEFVGRVDPQALGVHNVLLKPFSTHELADAVRAALQKE